EIGMGPRGGRKAERQAAEEPEGSGRDSCHHSKGSPVMVRARPGRSPFRRAGNACVLLLLYGRTLRELLDAPTDGPGAREAAEAAECGEGGWSKRTRGGRVRGGEVSGVGVAPGVPGGASARAA